MHTRVMRGIEFLPTSIWGSVLLVVISACSGAGNGSPGNNGADDGGNASRKSDAGASIPSDSGSYTKGTGGRALGSGGASGGDAGDTSSGGTMSAGGNTTGSAGHSGAGGTSQCDADLKTVSDDFQMAVSNADLSCMYDTECVEGPTPECEFYCGAPVVSKKGAGSLQASIDDAAAACARIKMQGCIPPPHPCAPSIGTPACVGGMCKRFIPVAWSLVSFAQAPNSSVQCDSAPDACEVFTVYPDGRVTDAPPGAALRTAMLVPRDIERVTTIVESLAFRQEFFMASRCVATGAPHTPITLTRQDPSSNRYELLVQDCIYGDPADNDPRTLWLVAQNAFAPDAGP
jgi:hypothetical protein